MKEKETLRQKAGNEVSETAGRTDRRKSSIVLKIPAVVLLLLLIVLCFSGLYYLHRTEEGNREGVNTDTLIWTAPRDADGECNAVFCSYPDDAAWLQKNCSGAEYDADEQDSLCVEYLLIETDAAHADELTELLADSDAEILYIPADAAAAKALDRLGAPRCATVEERISFYIDMLKWTGAKEYPFSCVICPFGDIGTDGFINYGTDSFARHAYECDVSVVYRTKGEKNIRYVMTLYCDGVIVPAEEADIVTRIMDEE